MLASAVNRNSLARLTLTASWVLLTSCALATAPPRIVKGEEFPQEKVEKVQVGMSAQEVRDLLGRPFEIEVVGDRYQWRYYERERQDERIYILGLIPVKRPYWIVDTELIILLREDMVEEVSFQEEQVR